MKKEQKEFIKIALMADDGGRYNVKTAENIIYGSNRMDSVERALRMEQNYDISPYIWLKLFKKKEAEK